MKVKLIAVAALAFGSLTASMANAMPVVAISSSPATIIKVGYACGPGWHLNDWGHCAPNRWHRPPPVFRRHGPPPPPAYWRYHHREWERHHYGWN